MKILFTAENYYPKMSGVPVVVRYLAEGLSERGHQVHVVTRWGVGCEEVSILNGVLIHRFHIFANYLKKPCGEIEKYISFIKNGNFDAVIFECSQCVTTDAMLSELMYLNNAKIFHSHGFSGLLLKPFKFSKSIRSIVANTANYILWRKYYSSKFKKHVSYFDITMCLSEVDSSIDYLSRYAKSFPVVLLNAAQDMFFEKNIKKGNLTKYVNLISEKYYISVANYNEYKNQLGILKEFYKTTIKDRAMVFVGSTKTSYFKTLLKEKEKLDKKYGAHEIVFLCGVQREDIPGIISDAELYLVGSTFEEFSISLIEAMALGIPFVSTNVGNARLLPGGMTINSIGELHNVILELENDYIKYSSFSQRGKEFANIYCRISNIVDRLEILISQVVSLRKGV